ncbi:hypothetical protein ACJIZ3_013725 [Penstemon smallii]|uniref:Uncharacterized protein n=1 Tax=Penstemon smallii TaxID=265156 RepID=A0ABD3RHE4_9LAMI
MKRSTRLSSAVFQLTPTRTRFDLIIKAYEKKEKIASGLLEPFLAHLKTAQDQIAKGGYSILLEPKTESDAAWFTKATMERFVHFVNNPEVLERVYTLETEILQIEKAIAVQNNNDIGKNIVEDHQRKLTSDCEGNRSVPSSNEEKAIVLYKPVTQPPEPNGSCSQEGNSKVQLLKVLETRKIVLQREQRMAFARAVAADFDIDQMAPVVSFADCFGAMRLMEACSRFIDLWKSKHETKQWLDLDTSEELSTEMNSSGINLSATPYKHDESAHELSSENNLKSGLTSNADSPIPNARQEHFEGQFPHLVFPPWAMHAPPGVQPVFPTYPVQGVPYYQAYTSDGPSSHPPLNPMGPSPSNFRHQSGQKRQTLDSTNGNAGLETWEIDRTRSLDNTESEVSHTRKPRKRAGGSNKKQSGMVVIRNINYITSKEKKSGSESISDSDSDIDMENENYEADGHDVIQHNSKRSSDTKGSHQKSGGYNIDEVPDFEKDTDGGHWQAFQTCLLRGNDEDAHADNDESMFAMEKDARRKKDMNAMSDDPLALGVMDTGVMQDTRMSDIRGISGITSHRPRGSGDDALLSRADNDFRGTNNQTDIQFAETNGRSILSRTIHEDFMIGSQHHLTDFRNTSDTLNVNCFNGATSKMDREFSQGTADETFIVPFRSMSMDQVGRADINSIYLDSEIPSAHHKFENKVNFEPDALSLMPERGTEKRSTGYDLALDYEMQVCAGGSHEKREKYTTGVKGGLRKLEKDRRSMVISDSSNKQKTGGPIRKGKSSKMSPLEDARARAEKLRSYKADLQKIKKEKEQADAKRLEALKLERQKRISARGSSTAANPGTLSPQTKQLPAKHSPITNRGSKFSDSETGPSSPLQRSKVRTSLGSSELLKVSKVNKTHEGSHMAGNRLTRSSSSLSEMKRESAGVTPDSKATMARIRRLSEPKTISNPPVISMKARSAEAVQKRKLSEEPVRNKTSAIINHDRSELKIKPSKSHINAAENKVTMKDRQNVNGMKSSTFRENAEMSVSNCSTNDQMDADDNPIVEKTVVMLAPSLPMDGVNRNPIITQLQKQSEANEVRTAYSEKDPPLSTTAEKPYRAPYAHVSSLEDTCTGQSEYCKAPQARSDLLSRVEETVKAHIPEVKTIKMDKQSATSEKKLVKEPSKGLRRFMKFGKKNPSSSVDQSVDSECTSLDGTKHNDNARSTASTSEVNTVKNLILQDQTSHAVKEEVMVKREMDISLKELAKKLDDFAKARDWEKYHSPRNLLLAMVGEVGELSEIFQWKGEVEKGLPNWEESDKEHLGEELSDVLLYLIRLADICGIDLPHAATKKIAKNAIKYPSKIFS